MTRRLLFRRDFRSYQGGHGKVWDYYRHTAAHPRWEPNVHFTRESVDAANPWRESAAAGIVPGWSPRQADALFLGGMDWVAWPGDREDTPVVNLIQHVRHADKGSDVNAFLGRRAIRLCVSDAVADALRACGVRGPLITIDAALDLAAVGPANTGARAGIVIGATKQPALGHGLAAALRVRGNHVTLLDTSIPRHDYLAALACADIAVLLPHAREGFYLPALEAMALGCATVVPDCIGNRAYAQAEVNALVPDYTLEALLAAVARLEDEPLRERLRDAGSATAARFSQARERQAFHAVLDDLPALWAAA